MNDIAHRTDILVAPKQHELIFKLYDDGLYMQAYRLAESIGPLQNWRGAEGRILAGRLAGNLGSLRLANWHFIHAWRHDRRHPEAMWYFARYLLGVRGPLAAWKFVQSQAFPKDAPPTLQSHWFSQHAAILGRLRDFDAAEEWLRKAEALGEQAWTCLERAGLYALEDRNEEAEAAARQSLVLHPWYRPAVQWVAHFLVQKERDDEAFDLLIQATRRLESGAIFGQLAVLQIELKRYDDASRSLDECERLSPLLDNLMQQWLDARRCDLACHQGDFDKAIRHATRAIGDTQNASGRGDGLGRGLRLRPRNKFYENLIPLLSTRTGPGKRVEVPVGFVRQHHKTCAPATLVALAKYWAMPAEHLEVAAEISYAGTPHHSQRKWANEHGWFTKEFTVTWDSAVALIDRGIPFTLTTTEVTSAHLQAVIGYDSLRRTLILRDPGDRHQIEMAFDVMCERYRSTGPRGMAMVPSAQQDRLASLPLPDETLYDHLHRLEMALKEHRRDEAHQALQAMVRVDAKHFLTLTARRTIAFYDTDLPDELIQTEHLLELYPGDLHLELARANLLSVLGRYNERLEILKKLAEKKETDPACWQQYALELGADARQHPQALYLLRKAVRANPTLARTYGTLARIRSSQRKFDEALQLFHFAVCLEEKDEYIVQDYFFEARAQGKTDAAVQLLQRRFERLGRQSNQPARTLYFAQVQLGRYDDAFNVLERAMAMRPDDGELLTYAADAHMLLGDFDRAAQILERARGVSKPAARFRSLATLANHQGDSLQAREHWEEVLKIEPTADDAHRAYCQLLAEKVGRGEAVRHLEAACTRFPHHFHLNRLLFEWLYEDGPVVREKALKKLIDIHPADAWTRREYALNLMEQDRLDEGFEQLDEADPLEPSVPNAWYIRALLYKKRNRTEDAQHALREAIRRSVDFEPAIQELFFQCENLQDRREAAAFVVNELLRQRTFGGGIIAMHGALQLNFPPQDVLAIGRRIRDARPDLWSAWETVTRQAGYCERVDEYLETAQAAVQRFPAISNLWLDLAQVQRVKKNDEAELQALERAVELGPTSSDAVLMLAEAHERAGSIDKARKVFVEAIRLAPLYAVNYLNHADFLYRNGDHDQAINQALHALKLDNWYEVAWSRVCTWYLQLDRIDEAIQVARDATKKRPGDSRSWVRLAQALQWQTPRLNVEDEKTRIDDCDSAYDEALKRTPLARDIYDMKAEMLALAGRYDAARKACNPPVYKGKPPLELRGRAAWIKAQEGDHEAAKQQMGTLLKEDRFYHWGWTQLADWSFATHEYRAYHDAANDMLRARPQSATALTYRGEARVRMDERDSGIEDLRGAFRKDPCNTLAAYLLFDEQMTDENFVGAEATMLSLQQSLAGDYVKARQVQLQAKRENKAIALDIFKFLCTSIYPTPQPLDMAFRALDLAGWKAEAEKIVRDVLKDPSWSTHLLRDPFREPAWNTHLALMYASAWNPNLANDLPDRIAMIDRALERMPGNFRYLDLKADLLTSGNQFERAWQVCKEKTFPQDQHALDGRAAWVMYRSGRQAEAIATMNELVQKQPKYFWGWIQLADWYGRLTQWVDVLTVAEQMVIISPRDPTGYFYRGQAKENLGDPQAARADYMHALDLQPTYMYAAWHLFNVYVRSAEWQRAEKILEKAKKHSDPGDWALRKVDSLIYQNKKAQFAAEFENLCRKSAKAPWLIDQSLAFVVQVGWWSEAEEVLHRCLDLGPHICDPWVRLRVAMGDRAVGDDVQNMSERRPERTNCIAAYAIELAYAKDPAGLRRWINTHDECLRDDTPCWAKVGLALSVVADWQGVLEWMSDWDEHPKALPGMLLPLVRAYRSLGRVEESRKVGLHALTKLNPDYANSFHKVWLMYDQALNGEVLPVQRYLEQADLGGFDGYHQMIAAMVRALWLTTTNKETGFAEARRILSDAAKFAPPTLHDPALKASYQKCVSQMAQTRGTFGARLWRMWRWLKPTLPAVPKVG